MLGQMPIERQGELVALAPQRPRSPLLTAP
jgi:hypothetical protein